jgi:tRNA(His) 5'-end guanylyltransferase
MISSFASVASSKYTSLDILFDATFVEFDKDYEIVNYLVWRQKDCKRNSTTLLYKCVHNTNNAENISLYHIQQEMNDLSIPDWITRGHIMKKERLLEPVNQDPVIINEHTTVVPESKERIRLATHHFDFDKNFQYTFYSFIEEKYL